MPACLYEVEIAYEEGDGRCWWVKKEEMPWIAGESLQMARGEVHQPLLVEGLWW
jgi:hypothetical protein